MISSSVQLPDGYHICKAGFGEYYWVEGCCNFAVSGGWHGTPDSAVQDALKRIREMVDFKKGGGVGAPSWFYNNRESEFFDNNG